MQNRQLDSVQKNLALNVGHTGARKLSQSSTSPQWPTEYLQRLLPLLLLRLSATLELLQREFQLELPPAELLWLPLLLPDAMPHVLQLLELLSVQVV